MRLFLGLFLTLMGVNLGVQGLGQPKIVGYYTSWAQFRAAAGQFTPEDIDGKLLTHAVYAFAKFDYHGRVAPLEHNDLSTEHTAGMYERFNDLKKQYPHLKTLLSIGGATAQSASFATVLRQDKVRRKLARDLVKYAIRHGFEGVDIDWEFEKATAKSSANCSLLIKFLQELRLAANSLQRRSFLITAVVGQHSVAGAGACIVQIAQLVDWLNVIGYDFHGSWDHYTDANAPLYRDHGSADSIYYIDHLIQKYLKLGVNPAKLVLGIPAYGRSYGNVHLRRFFTKPRNKSTGPGAAGKYTKQPGILAFYEINQLLQAKQLISAWDRITDTPYAYNFYTKEWVSYDDQKSVALKTDYINKMHLGGAMLWALPLDDFRNGYPLLKTINRRLKKAYLVNPSNPFAYR